MLSFFLITLLIFEIAYGAYMPFHAKGVAWMGSLVQPAFSPPCWLAAAAWPLLYLLMAAAVWIVWNKRHEKPVEKALTVFTLQFLVNILWGPLVVNMQCLNLALLYDCILFPLAIMNTVVFCRVSEKAGLLLVPYVLWMGYFLYLLSMLWINTPVT